MGDEGKKRLGERVRKARRDTNLTQEELADKLGVTQGVISNVETGISTIDAPTLPIWAEALNKPIMYFYSDEEFDLHKRALTILNMFPEDRLEFVFQMLENMALTIQQQKEE